MQLIFASLTSLMLILGQKPAASHQWQYLKQFDAISATSADLLSLQGKWDGLAPSFPYQNSFPLLVVSCQDGAWQMTAVSSQALLQSGDWPILNRIDDVRGEFHRTLLAKSTDTGVFITKDDFGKIMRANTVIVRLQVFRDGPRDAEFDLSVSDSKVKEKCQK